VAAVLYHQGHIEPALDLERDARDMSTPPNKRREILRRLITIDARRFAPMYIEVLSDPDIWVRYVASNTLRLLAGSTFGYSYRRGRVDEHPIAQWREWYRRSAETLPARWSVPLQPGSVGMRIVATDGELKLSEVTSDGEAFRAGVRPGDILERVDGDPALGKDPWEITVYELRGLPDTFVAITVRRPPHAGMMTFTVRRSATTAS
jgi:hypothetical protein